jgi:hypothetical protein
MGKAISSEALKATALDSLTDAIATCAIMVSGILCPRWALELPRWLYGHRRLLFVGYSGIKMIKDTADPLIGEKGNRNSVNNDCQGRENPTLASWVSTMSFAILMDRPNTLFRSMRKSIRTHPDARSPRPHR